MLMEMLRRGKLMAGSGLALATLLFSQQRGYFSTQRAAGAEASPRFHMYFNPLCPYVQRARITLSEYNAASLFKFTAVPLKREIDAAKQSNAIPKWAAADGLNSAQALDDLKQWYMANINKAGEVPTLLDSLAPGLKVRESDVVAEYIALQLEGQTGERNLHLFPDSSFKADEIVRFRMAAKTLPYGTMFSLLLNKDPSKDAQLLDQLVKGMDAFVSNMASGGPYYLGSRYSFADINNIPHVIRIVVLLRHYRGIDIFDPALGYDAKRLKVWYDAVAPRPAVKNTTPTNDEMIEMFKADANTAKISDDILQKRAKA